MWAYLDADFIGHLLLDVLSFQAQQVEDELSRFLVLWLADS